MLSVRFSFSPACSLGERLGLQVMQTCSYCLALERTWLTALLFSRCSIAWQWYQFWGSVKFYSISWYGISSLVLGGFQVKAFCCVFLVKFWCSWYAKYHRKKRSRLHKMLPNVYGEAKQESCSCFNILFSSGSSRCYKEQELYTRWEPCGFFHFSVLQFFSCRAEVWDKRLSWYRIKYTVAPG